MSKSVIIITGLVGLFGALLTGVGEFILHFDHQARFADNQFFLGITPDRSTTGHFFAALGAPLYLVGCWHLNLMLRPANSRWAMIAFLVAAYGFVVGIIWIGSRASLSALINMPVGPDVSNLIGLYDLRYESLLQVTRFTVLFLSIIYIWLISTGKTHYPKWMIAANPILLLVLSFIIYLVAPAVGKYMMPIALNIAFSVLFILSLYVAHRKGL